jgi:hypothetical protein
MYNPHEELMTLMFEIKELIKNNTSVAVNKSPVYFLTAKAAEYLSISPNALRVMVSKGQIQPCKKLGKNYFLLDDLVNWIESGRNACFNEAPEDILITNRK